MRLKIQYIRLASLSLFWFVVGYQLSMAQSDPCNLTLTGKVMDQHNGEPLPFAVVISKDGKHRASTNLDGVYRMEGLCEGTCTFVCKHLGCTPVEKTVTLNTNSAVDFYMEHSIESLDTAEIIVKKRGEEETRTEESLQGQSLERLRGRSLGKSLEEIPGVSTLNTGATISKPVIQGLHSNRIQIRNNGLRQEDQQWGQEHAPNIDPWAMERLSVVKGASSVEYGAEAVAGVVIVEPEPLPTDSAWHGALHTVGYTNGWGGQLAGKLQKGSAKIDGFGWRVQGSLQKQGDNRAPDYILTNTGLYGGNVSTGIGLNRKKYGVEAYYSYVSQTTGILRSAHIGNLTDLENAIESDRPLVVRPFSYAINNPKQKVKHHLAKVEGYYRISNLGKLKLRYGYQFNRRKEFDIRRGDRDSIPALDIKLSTQTVDAILEHYTIRRFKGKIGVNTFYQKNLNVAGTGIRPLIPNYIRQSFGVFWIERYIKGKMELEAGIRYEHQRLEIAKFDQSKTLIQQTKNFDNVAGSLGWIQHMGEDGKNTLRINLGTAFRPPNVAELYSEGLHHGAAAIEIGDSTLNTEKTLKLVAGYTFNPKTWLNIQLEGHFSYFEDFIFLEPQDEAVLTIQGAFPLFLYKQTDALVYGGDLSALFDLGKGFFFQTKPSLLFNRDLDKKDFLPFFPANRWGNNLGYQRDSLGAFKNVYFLIRTSAVTQQRFAPKEGDFTSPPDGYFLTGIELDGELPLGKDNTLTLGLSVDNLFNVRYRDYLDRLRYFADETGTNVWLRVGLKF